MNPSSTSVSLADLLDGLSKNSADAGLRIESELSPMGGQGSPVKPAVYRGGRYQFDRRWDPELPSEPREVIVVDNPPSQANRIEAAICQNKYELGVPEIILDLTGSAFDHLPAHLPREISSWKWPHRHADAYLIDSLIDGCPSHEHPLGKALFSATSHNAAALVSWFPQSLMFGFWQSHLGKKRAQTKHARAWVSEIVGWDPAAPRDDSGEQLSTRTASVKGDPLNIGSDIKIDHDDKNRFAGYKVVSGSPKEGEKPSNLGHGQVPSTPSKEPPSGASFRKITQTSLVSFSLLRRVKLGTGHSSQADTAARALVVALGLRGYALAFGQAFHLRSGADLRPARITATWLGTQQDTSVGMGGFARVLSDAKQHARDSGVPLDGWDVDPIRIVPGKPLTQLILKTWPNLDSPARS